MPGYSSNDAPVLPRRSLRKFSLGFGGLLGKLDFVFGPLRSARIPTWFFEMRAERLGPAPLISIVFLGAASRMFSPRSALLFNTSSERRWRRNRPSCVWARNCRGRAQPGRDPGRVQKETGAPSVTPPGLGDARRRTLSPEDMRYRQCTSGEFRALATISRPNTCSRLARFVAGRGCP